MRNWSKDRRAPVNAVPKWCLHRLGLVWVAALLVTVSVVSCGKRSQESIERIPVPLEARTTFQVAPAWRPTLDLQTDAAIVYMGSDVEDFQRRIRSWQVHGYRTHMMLAVGRADRRRFLVGNWSTVAGRFDGKSHWGAVQVDSRGERLAHSSSGEIFYLVPTEAFGEYLRSHLRAALDAGAEVLCVEEPEFWARSGYSQAFKRAWRTAYHRPWQNPLSSPQTWLDAARLKQKLYFDLVDTLFRDAANYSRQIGRHVRLVVATHSPLNYAHWGIVSPETAFMRLPECDGFIAQVWTGTARTPVIYRGLRRERVFDLAYFEYGSVKSMVLGTGKSLWFLADPVEDDPSHDWEDYRRNYEETVVASLLHPEVAGYEIMPWPDRVLERKYARRTIRLTAEAFLQILRRARREIEDVRKTIPEDSVTAWERYLAEYPDSVRTVLRRANSPNLEAEVYRFKNRKLAELAGGAKQAIPPEYATELLLVADALRRMSAISPEAVHWEGGPEGIGVVFSDAAMLERGSPWSPRMESFYALALPVLDAGVPVQVAMLERFADSGYLSHFRCLLISFEAFKPFDEAAIAALVDWVKSGGAMMLYISLPDSFDSVGSWWRQAGFMSPAEALVARLGIGEQPGIHAAGRGWVRVVKASPAAISQQTDGTETVIQALEELCRRVPGLRLHRKGYLALRRGPYLVAASPHDALLRKPKIWRGGFLDLLDGRVPVREGLELFPGKVVFALDLARVGSRPQVLVSASRIKDFSIRGDEVRFLSRGPLGVLCKTVLRLPTRYTNVVAKEVSSGRRVDVTLYRDESRALTYLTYENQGSWVEVKLTK